MHFNSIDCSCLTCVEFVVDVQGGAAVDWWAEQIIQSSNQMVLVLILEPAGLHVVFL